MPAPFADFDWENSWRASEYAEEAYVGAAPSGAEVVEVERKLGYTLPRAYVELARTRWRET